MAEDAKPLEWVVAEMISTLIEILKFIVFKC